MATALLKTKLFIPPPRPSLVARPRVTEKLNSGLGGKFTLVSAPAGFGKSTALSNWPAAIRQQVAWLSLDEGDNEPVRFWTYVRAALQSLAPQIGDLAPLDAGQPLNGGDGLASSVVGLINQVAALEDRRLLLIVDDYHVISAPQVNDTFGFFVESLPNQLHLTLSGRTDPPWPLARSRARGELTEIRTQDLRFTTEEAAAFLRDAMGLLLSPEQIDALEERTEGWIAGLQMAALSMQDRKDLAGFIGTLSGSHRFIMDYLLEEVLNKQPESIRNFLLQTSILNLLTPSLCDAVTERADSEALLAGLEQSNLFLTAQDDRRQWYRYHHLFADLLVSRQQRLQPDHLRDLHRRASQWYGANGQLDEAMGHASASGDIERQVQLIAENVLSMAYEGQLTPLVKWLEALPLESVEHLPWFHISHAWVLAFAGHLEQVEPRLRSAEDARQDRLDQPEQDPVIGHITAIRAYVAGLRGEWRLCHRNAVEALRRLPHSQVKARSWTTLLQAIVLRQFGQLAEADRSFVEADRLSRTAEYIPLTADVLWERSELQRTQGKLRAALESCQNVLDMAERYRLQTGRRLPPTGYVYTGIAAVLHEWNDIDGALAYAREGVELCSRWGMADAVVRSHAQLSLTLQAAGHPDTADQVMVEAGRVAEAMSPMYRTYVENAAVRLHLAQGKLASAEEWTSAQGLQVDDEFDYMHAAPYTILARVLVEQTMRRRTGNSRRLLALLARLHKLYRDAGATGVLIRVLALEAVAHQVGGNHDAALAAIGEALRHAEPEGYRRTFVEIGQPMDSLLRGAIRAGIAPGYAQTLLDILEAGSAARPGAALIEPLTDRELDVLRLLPTSLTTVEIAQALVVAPSTVRTHIKHIYAKLHVSRRNDAVQRAAELHLL